MFLGGVCHRPGWKQPGQWGEHRTCCHSHGGLLGARKRSRRCFWSLATQTTEEKAELAWEQVICPLAGVRGV